MTVLTSTLLKLLLPTIAIIVIILVTRARRQPPDALGLQRPVWREAIVWFVVWIAWAAIAEIVIAKTGMDQPRAWSYPLAITILRVLAIGVAGPIVEELFRSLLIFVLKTRVKVTPAFAVVLSSLVWAFAHFQYDVPTITLIFLDGLILGTARVRSQSVYVPIAMHILGNLFSVWESIYGVPWA